MSDRRSSKSKNPIPDKEQADGERETIRKALIETEGPTRAEIEEQKRRSTGDDGRKNRPPRGQASP